MKAVIVGILFLLCTVAYAQDSLIYPGHKLIDRDQEICWGTCDQRACFDTLIRHYELALSDRYFPSKTPETTRPKFYKKLLLFHIQAAGITFARKNYKEAFRYFERAELYSDSLQPYKRHDPDIENLLSDLPYFERNMCSYLYQKDSMAFYDCNCKRFFPELDETDTTATVVLPATTTATPPVKRHFGEFYHGDTLWVDAHYSSNPVSTKYLKEYQYQFLAELKQVDLHELSVEGHSTQDTLIIRFQVERTANAIKRNCSVVKSNCPKLLEQGLLEFTFSMKLPYIPGQGLDLYIPFILRPEDARYANNMNRCVIAEDHFLIEYEVLQPIRKL